MVLPSLYGLEPKFNRENENSHVYFFENAPKKALDQYVDRFLSLGFAICEERSVNGHSFVALFNGRDGVFVNYFEEICELYIVIETETAYFSHVPTNGAGVTPQITQIKLEDFGMSYAVRLSDGRFIIIDGGREFLPDAERLYECLKQGSNGRPRIASWIMTHPHSDHFHCFLTFFDNHENDVDIESFMLNFPNRDDTEHYPKMTAKDPRFIDSSPFTNIKLMYDRIEKTGARV